MPLKRERSGTRKIYLIILAAAGLPCAWTDYQGTVADFLGVNANVAAYDQGYLTDISQAFKWIREYHNWAHYEAANNFYKWDDVTTEPQGWTWPDHHRFMDSCQALGVNVLIDVLGSPDWASSTPIPNSTGDGSSASDYMERLEFLGQLTARYGSKVIDAALLETADKVSGVNLIKYYEDENEQDYWWASPLWPAEHYAKYLMAAHDGTGVVADGAYPLAGIKSVDPDAVHVLGGLAGPDTAYITRVLEASGGTVPFDVLNFHIYNTDHTDASAPENEEYGMEQAFAPVIDWRDAVLPGVPVWVTEFGWDTYMAPGGGYSYTFAPDSAQAKYLLRAFFIQMHLGIEKAFMFMASDTDSEGLIQYSTSGMVTDAAGGHQRKLSWYYLVTLQNLLGHFKYAQTLAYREGDPEKYILKFTNPNDAGEEAYVMWCRSAGTHIDDGAHVNDHRLEAPGILTAAAVRPADGKTGGDTVSLSVDVVNSAVVIPEISEAPLFVIVRRDSASSVRSKGPVRSEDIFMRGGRLCFRDPTTADQTLFVFAVSGKMLLEMRVPARTRSIPMKKLPQGVYRITLRQQHEGFGGL